MTSCSLGLNIDTIVCLRYTTHRSCFRQKSHSTSSRIFLPKLC